MKKYLISFPYTFFLLAAILLTIPGGRNAPNDSTQEQPDTKDLMESNIDNFESEYDGGIDDLNSITIGRRHQMLIEAIAKGNKQQFADLVVYPVRRTSPIPDIENKEQMVSYFDTLFDKSFRERIAHLDSNSWEEIGWRGWMLLNGEIWDTEPGIVINYSSPLEQQYAQELENKDMARVHPSLRGSWKPYDCYLLDCSEFPFLDYSFARLDESTNQGQYEEPQYRLAIYRKGAGPSDRPSIVLMGKRVIEGSANIVSFNFETDDYTISLDPENIHTGKPSFTVTSRHKEDLQFVVPGKGKFIP